MAFEDIKIQIDMLLDETQDRPENWHTVYLKVMQDIGELRAFGMPVPDDLVDLERALEEKFSSELPQTTV